jgi:hypothetical protein
VQAAGRVDVFPVRAASGMGSLAAVPVVGNWPPLVLLGGEPGIPLRAGPG